MSKKILFIDGDPALLNQIAATFQDTEAVLLFAGNLEEAKQMLKEQVVALLALSLSFDEEEGMGFLEETRETYPAILRVVYGEKIAEKKITKILEKGLCKTVIDYEQGTESIKQAIHQVISSAEKLTDPQLLSIINGIDNLPTIPLYYRKLNMLIEKDEDMAKIADEVSKDQSVAAKILRMANFAFYNKKTGSIKEAIMVLGLSNVKSIIISNTVFNPSTYGLYHQTLWQHSILVNNLCREIYKRFLEKPIPSMYATAGLMHDIGKVVMMSGLKKDYNQLLFQVSAQEHKHILDLEKERFQITHQEIGAILLDWWGLPHPIVEAALYHHEPLNPDIINKEIVYVVHLANYYAWHILRKQVFMGELVEETFEILGMSKEEFENFILIFEMEMLPNLKM